MYTLENVQTARSYRALKRNGFTDANIIKYYNMPSAFNRKTYFTQMMNQSKKVAEPLRTPKKVVEVKVKTQMCTTVDMDSVRDMALDYIGRTWTYKGRDFNLVDMGWKFNFNDRKNANGLCSPRRRTIFLSTYVVENATREMSGWINTMVHEIAHAINHHLGGRGHDAQWRRIFLSFGGSGERCSSDITFGNLIEKPISKYTNVCPNGHQSPSHKYSRVMAEGRRSCGKCSSVFDKAFVLKQIQNY